MEKIRHLPQRDFVSEQTCLCSLSARLLSDIHGDVDHIRFQLALTWAKRLACLKLDCRQVLTYLDYFLSQVQYLNPRVYLASPHDQTWAERSHQAFHWMVPIMQEARQPARAPIRIATMSCHRKQSQSGVYFLTIVKFSKTQAASGWL